MRVFHFAALAVALLVVSATILYSPSSTDATPTSSSSTFSSSTAPPSQLSTPWANEGAAFPLPPRWVVLALNRVLFWLQSLRDSFLPPQLRLLELHFKFVHNRALHAAATLGLADVVPPEPEQLWPTSSEIAQRLKARDEELVYRFLRLLSSIGVFEEHAERRFGHTPMSLLLRRDHPQSVRASILCFGLAQYEGWNGLSHMLLTGETAFDHVNGGKDLWAYYNEPEHHRELEYFQKMLVQTLSITTPPIVQDFDWPALVQQVQREKGSEQVSIIDVGGGLGTVLHLLLENIPSSEVSGILFDQESVIEKAQTKWADDPLRNRTTFTAGSFLDRIPEADVFVLRMVLHDWNDNQAALILKNIRYLMKPHSRVVVIENVMPPEGQHSHLIPLSVEVQDLHMMVMLGGKERTGRQFEQLFSRAGLALARSVPTRGIYHIIEGRLA